MGNNTPRLRMFASLNGSGKSSIKDVLPPGMPGFYVSDGTFAIITNSVT